MRLNRALNVAALMCAASLNVSVAAQDVPAPPPAGVKPVPRKAPVDAKPTPPEAIPAQEAQPVPEAKSDSLPQIPENPIRLEDERSRPTPAPVPVQDPAMVPTRPLQAMPAAPGEAPVATRPPVKPKGPVYYYPFDPYTFPANVNTPPAMHIPNSPFVEDLSVAGDHGRYTYYSYRRPWYTPGHQSANVTIVW